MMLAPDERAPLDEGTAPSSALPSGCGAPSAINTREPVSTVIIDTGNTALYYVLGQGRALHYGVGVSMKVYLVRRANHQPEGGMARLASAGNEMIARQPYLPRFMAGGPGQPAWRPRDVSWAPANIIHGTNDPSTIGKFVPSGCIRLTNEDVADLFGRVDVGTRIGGVAEEFASP